MWIPPRQGAHLTVLCTPTDRPTSQTVSLSLSLSLELRTLITFILYEQTCEKYDNLSEIDKLASVTRKVDAVKLVMQDNVDMALQNCVKLETIEKATEELQQVTYNISSGSKLSELLCLCCQPIFHTHPLKTASGGVQEKRP